MLALSSVVSQRALKGSLFTKVDLLPTRDNATKPSVYSSGRMIGVLTGHGNVSERGSLRIQSMVGAGRVKLLLYTLSIA